MERLIQEALALHRAGRLPEAEAMYLEILKADKSFYPALHQMGVLRLQQGRPADALSFIESGLLHAPGTPELLSNYALALLGVSRNSEALEALESVTRIAPTNSHAWSRKSVLLSKLNRNQDALTAVERAIELDPANEEAWNNRGLIHLAMGQAQEALQSFDRVLQRRPTYVEVRNNRGLALKALMRTPDALAEFDRVLEQNPAHAGAFVNRAAVLRTIGDVDLALDSYARALAIQPDMPEALSSRARCLWAQKNELARAMVDLERLVHLRPDHPYARGDLVHLRMFAANWSELARERSALDEGVRTGKRVVEPHVYNGISSSPSDLLACAQIYVQDKYPPRNFEHHSRRGDGKIRLGYVCGEFRSHATMYLAAGLFEQHDRGRFEVVGFDNGHEDDSSMRRRAKAAFDKFVPIKKLSDEDAARLVAREGIDILIDLNGFCGDLRLGIFARRAAPIQVNYLGFPGSLGAEYMDYILADAEVVPAGQERFYTEKVVRIPGSYQINDNTRPRAAPHARAPYGLNEKDFVFCHFNGSYKITPEMFAIWLRLLARVPSSVLWLLESNAMMAPNLRREAAAAGIDPDRLIFAPRIEMSAHVSRLSVGDLFLDSLPYNAHTTASDALWAGLPLITCRGTTFAGRVAASLLQAVGLPELITDDLAAYESLALKLSEDRALLRSYRARLNCDPHQLPLFDTARTTQRIEAAYEGMMDRRTKGALIGFDVPDTSPQARGARGPVARTHCPC